MKVTLPSKPNTREQKITVQVIQIGGPNRLIPKSITKSMTVYNVTHEQVFKIVKEALEKA